MESRRHFREEFVPTSDAERAEGDRLVAAGHARFEALSEEDQVLSLLSTRLGFGMSGHGDNRNPEDFARDHMTQFFGPKFADRVLGDPELRAKIGLDQ